MVTGRSCRQGKYVHDAREVLDRNGAASYERRIADELLDQAAALDAVLMQGTGGDVLMRYGRDRVARLKKGSRARERATESYARAFLDYIRGQGKPESLGLHVGDAAKGGYACPLGFVGALNTFLDNAVSVRRLSRILPPTTAPEVVVSGLSADYGDHYWIPEVATSDLTEDDSSRLASRRLTPHLAAKMVKFSKTLMHAAEPDLLTVLVSRLGVRCAQTEEKGFLTGSGAGQPLGVFTASPEGITTSQDVTASAATTFTGDDLINCLFGLSEVHLERSTWLFGKQALKIARVAKDSSGQYLWRAGLGGLPGTLLDRPYVLSASAPSTYTSGLYVAVVGDFSGYFVQDGLGVDVQVIRELLALRQQVAVIVRKEVDGMPAIPEAFRRLKLA